MRRTLNVWIVDDDEIHQFVMKMGLETLTSVSDVKGYTDPEEALYAVKNLKDPVDLLMLDLNMPNMDGREFLKVLEKEQLENRFKAIWLVSSSTLQADQDLAEEHALISRYCIKPIKIEEADKHLKALLEAD